MYRTILESWLFILFPQTSENEWRQASAPSFHQRSAEFDRFGFGTTPQFIVPPGTEPDLQALNNPYIAAARRDASSRPGVQYSPPRESQQLEPSLFAPSSNQTVYLGVPSTTCKQILNGILVGLTPFLLR